MPPERAAKAVTTAKVMTTSTTAYSAMVWPCSLLARGRNSRFMLVSTPLESVAQTNYANSSRDPAAASIPRRDGRTKARSVIEAHHPFEGHARGPSVRLHED